MTSVLVRSFFFVDLTPAELQPLAVRSHVQHYDAGQHLYRSGDAAVDLCVVVDGQLKERLLSSDGNETITDLVGAGGTVGEPGLFAPERNRIVDLVAVRRSHVVRIPRDAFVDAITGHPAVALRLAEGLATDLRWAVQRLGDLGYARVRDRLITTLRDLAVAYGTPGPHGMVIALSLNHATLAGMVAATRENITRAMTELNAAGAVLVEDGIYHVNPEGLQRLAKIDPPVIRRRQAERDDIVRQ